MFLPDVFNRIGVYQRLGGFVEKYGDKRKTQINEFLLHATSLILSLYRIKYLNDLCIEQFSKEKKNLTITKESRILFTSPAMVEMISLMPACFSSLCVMQDKIFPMFDEILGVKNPSQSFHSVQSKLPTYVLKKEIVELTSIYWKTIGKITREYRDVGQHFYNLVSHSYFQTSPEEKPIVLLPDNPDAKSYHKFTYEKVIDCSAFLTQAFNELHAYIEKMLELNDFEKRNLTFRFNMEPAKELVQGVKETLVLALYDEKGEVGIEVGHLGDGRIYLRSVGNWESPRGRDG